LAWGIVGIAAAAAIVNVILGLNKLALASGFFVFVGMVILFAFAQIPARDRVTRLAGQSLVAAVALATVIFIGSSLWAAMFCAPPGFVYLYGLDGVCRSQPSLPPKTPDPQPKVTEAQPRAVEAQPKISEIASFEYNDKFGKVSVEKDRRGNWVGRADYLLGPTVYFTKGRSNFHGCNGTIVAVDQNRVSLPSPLPTWNTPEDPSLQIPDQLFIPDTDCGRTFIGLPDNEKEIPIKNVVTR
jgi:hypothetical protein